MEKTKKKEMKESIERKVERKQRQMKKPQGREFEKGKGKSYKE